MDREQRRVVAVDPRQQGEGDRDQAADERHGPATRHGVRRVRRVRPAGPPRATDRERDQRPGSAAARTSSRRGGCRRSAARPGPGRGRAPPADGERDHAAATAAATSRRTVARRARRRRHPAVVDVHRISSRHRPDARSARRVRGGVESRGPAGRPVSWPSVRTRCPSVRTPVRVPATPHGSRTLMSSPPGRGRSSAHDRRSGHRRRPDRRGHRVVVLGIDLVPGQPGRRPELLPAAGRHGRRATRSTSSTRSSSSSRSSIFFVVEGLIVWTVIRYRRKPGDDELPPQTHGNNLAEVVWTVVPTLIVIFLFFISWQTLNTVEATSAQPQIKVRAHGRPVPVVVRLPADRRDPATNDLAVRSITAPDGPDGGLTLPAGQTTHLFLPEPGRHPRVLRPAVPVQAGRRAGPDQRVRPHGRGRAMPARRSTASAPSCAATGHDDHDLRRPRDEPAPTSRRGSDQKIAAANASPPAAAAAVEPGRARRASRSAGGGAACQLVAPEHRVRRDRR